MVKIIALSGPSGSGKTTLINKLINEFPSEFVFIVSYTTREPRDRELDNVDYKFISSNKFEEMLKDNKFIEHATFSGNKYGTTFDDLNKQHGKNVVLIFLCFNLCFNLYFNWESKKEIIAKCQGNKILFCFIKPPSVKELKKRLMKRGTECSQSFNKRMESVEDDMKFLSTEHLFDKIIVNENLETAYKNFKDFCFSI